MIVIEKTLFKNDGTEIKRYESHAAAVHAMIHDFPAECEIKNRLHFLNTEWDKKVKEEVG